jgi:putative ABC transport system permease protein
MSPPRGALLMMRLLLPHGLREAISGDLEEEWNLSARPSRLRFWSLALRSVIACWTARARFASPRPAACEPPRKGDGPMQSLLQDIRYGFRLMRRSPGFTVAAVATLALGIGANSAIFSLINVLSLKPLPYREPSRVAFVLGWDLDEGEMRFNLRLADYIDLQQQSQSLESWAAYTYLSANLTGGDVPERVQAYRITANTLSMLGVPAALGRIFEPGDALAGHDDVVVISHGLWQRRFGGDAAVIGRKVVLNGRPHSIVGVMPPRFEFPVFNFKGDLWIPWPMTDAARGQASAGQSTTVVGRLRPDVPYERAQAELDTIMRSLATQYPDTNRGLGVRIMEMGRLDDEQVGPAMTILLVTVSMVLLLACANVANLLLARGVSRHRELAVRAAVGASRLRIGRQLLVESLLLALAGGAVGVLLARLALRALLTALPEMVLTTAPNIDELGVDSVTLLYTTAVSLVTSLVFGLVPAWRAARGHFQDGLKEAAAAGGSRGTRRLRTALVVAEVALSTMLLVAAGLLVRSYAGLQRVQPGFARDGVLTLALALPDYKYTDAPKRLQFYEQTLDRIERLPGVRSAGYVNVLPFSTYDRGTRLIVEGEPPPEPGREPSVSFRVASPRYLETLRIQLVEGRPLDRQDRADEAPVAVVNRALVRRLFGGQSPLGRRVRLGPSQDAPWTTIVGVVGDVHHWELSRAPDPEIYVPMSQTTPPMMMLAVRSDGRPEDLIRAVQAEIQAVDPGQPVYHVKSMDQLVSDSMMTRTTSAALMALFSLLALLLAAVGVYGVVAYGVSQQTREFGLRIALGATPRDLLAAVLGHGLMMVGAGVALGSIVAFVVSRFIAGALFGVGPGDPVTYATAAGLIVATGLVACTVPAWRASRVQPVIALRAE